MQVTCRLTDYSKPAKPSILINNAWNDKTRVEIQIGDERYTVDGRELIEAVKNAMNTGECW